MSTTAPIVLSLPALEEVIRAVADRGEDGRDVARIPSGTGMTWIRADDLLT